jgi:hypothetical protein
MKILAIDPGPVSSCVLALHDGRVEDWQDLTNYVLIDSLREGMGVSSDLIAIEMIACYGMPVGAEVFETCCMIGRIEECAERNLVPTRRVFRKDIKLHLCGTPRAKDGNVRQALIDRLGSPGTKKAPGPTYGVSGHAWAALAAAVYAADTTKESKTILEGGE